MPSFNRHYSRFIPSEEVGVVTQWKFGAVDGSDLVEPAPEPEALPEPAAPVVDEAVHLAMIQQTWDDAFAQGLAQGQSETALEWQHRMDEYIAQQGNDLAQRLHAVTQSLEASLAGFQQNMAQEVLALACEIAKQVVRKELSCNSQTLLPVVQEAVGMLLAEGRPAVVRMNPSDMETLQDALLALSEGGRVQWLADASVSAGDCFVESGGTVVDGSVAKRWERAVAALGLQSPWDEQAGQQEAADAH
ncbi:flagellar assembly protein FliH [Acidovorax sp. DW039]|uniref:FliH/SctL family protein n=1 Tax=Acidovorax sp. DW039 TaxID=3095606 RepID=UPI00308FA542|nr:flagellar assembly protein FliH [Acidovorax sp. DW039]